MVQESGGIMSTTTIHTLKSFRKDHRYIRESLRLAEKAIASGNWSIAQGIYAEMSAIGGLLEQHADENATGAVAL
jgi:hypothetical protein